MPNETPETPTLLSLDDHVCFGIYAAHLAIQRTHKPVLDTLGVTYPQYLVMNLLWAQDGQTVGSLAKLLDLEPSTLTPLLKRLEGIGLLERRRAPENERQVIISLTEKGRSLRADAGCVSQNLLEKSEFTPNQLAEINGLVRDLSKKLNERMAD